MSEEEKGGDKGGPGPISDLFKNSNKWAHLSTLAWAVIGVSGFSTALIGTVITSGFSTGCNYSREDQCYYAAASAANNHNAILMTLGLAVTGGLGVWSFLGVFAGWAVFEYLISTAKGLFSPTQTSETPMRDPFGRKRIITDRERFGLAD